jgi:hypothetical protein
VCGYGLWIQTLRLQTWPASDKWKSAAPPGNNESPCNEQAGWSAQRASDSQQIRALSGAQGTALIPIGTTVVV